MRLGIVGSSTMRASINFIRNCLIAQEVPLEKIKAINVLPKEGISHSGKMYALKEEITLTEFDVPPRIFAQRCDAILLIWDGVSKGSKDLKIGARAEGKPIFEVILHGPTHKERKRLNIYVEPKDRISTINKSNKKDINPGALV